MKVRLGQGQKQRFHDMAMMSKSLSKADIPQKSCDADVRAGTTV
jgi:hypothetical protein